MTIVFLSNFFNHHQAYLSNRLYELTDGNYRFVATEAVPEERKKLGYSECAENYVIQYGTDAAQDAQVQKLIDSADVVIVGSAPEALLKNRKKQKKRIVRYSERPLKKGFQWWKYPLRLLKWHYENPCNVPIYMLCASAYTASDYAKFGLFRNRTLRWGYFPECKKYDDINGLMNGKQTNEILWCGRLIDWKHPDDVLLAAEQLKAEGCDFRIRIIGTGEMEQQLKETADRKQLLDVVDFLGSMPPERVRAHMEQAGIYLFTSDRKEGWGAVLNEAMNSGCAVVASSDAGSTPYLVKDGVNGTVYTACHVRELCEKIKYLLDDPVRQKQMGMAAYETIAQEWNPEVAAERLLTVLDQILNGDTSLSHFSEGPCSRT